VTVINAAPFLFDPCVASREGLRMAYRLVSLFFSLSLSVTTCSLVTKRGGGGEVIRGKIPNMERGLVKAATHKTGYGIGLIRDEVSHVRSVNTAVHKSREPDNRGD